MIIRKKIFMTGLSQINYNYTKRSSALCCITFKEIFLKTARQMCFTTIELLNVRK